ncbi:MAG: ATP-binding protein [Proteobacteria bacterium]|nr:ATP-binding protein [Pseudomonadota bacterium]
MINEETIKQLMDMKLYGMAASFRDYLEQTEKDELTYEERFGMMADREWTERQERRMKYRLSRAKLREQACVEDINYRHPRKLDRSVMQRLVAGKWMTEHENVIFTGPTGVGKTWLACALTNKACREGHTALYVRVPRLLQDLYVAHADGTYPKVMDRLAKPDVMILDDFGLAPLSDTERRDFLEVIEDRQGRRSTIITSQLSVKHWHEMIGEPTIADAILDRLVSSSHRIDMNGKSLRQKRKSK